MNLAATVQKSTFISDSKRNKKIIALGSLLAAAVLMTAMPDTVFAGDAGTNTEDFDTVWTTLKEWTQGSLGRVIAGSMILVGIIGGIARQSIMAFAIGIAGGMGLTYAPDIIEVVVTATLENAEAATVAAIQVSNGLGL